MSANDRSNFGMSKGVMFGIGGFILLLIIAVVVIMMMKKKKSTPASAFGRRWR